MTQDEFEVLFEKLITGRNLTADEDTWAVWWEAVGDIDASVFKEAVRRMIAEDEAYPSPAHVRRVCGHIVQQRLARTPQPTPPSGLSTDEYFRWEREWSRQIVRGTSAEEASTRAIEAAHNTAALEGSAQSQTIIRNTIAPF